MTGKTKITINGNFYDNEKSYYDETIFNHHHLPAIQTQLWTQFIQTLPNSEQRERYPRYTRNRVIWKDAKFPILNDHDPKITRLVVLSWSSKQPYKRKQNKILEKFEKRWLLDFSMNRAEIPRLYDTFRNEMEHQTSNDTIKRLVWEHLWMCNCVKHPISIHRQAN